VQELREDLVVPNRHLIAPDVPGLLGIEDLETIFHIAGKDIGKPGSPVIDIPEEAEISCCVSLLPHLYGVQSNPMPHR
jgi:hypothetical protein